MNVDIRDNYIGESEHTMKKIQKKQIAVICLGVLVLGIAVYFLMSPGYFRDFSELVPVKPSWTQETVIIYEEQIFKNSTYEKEETDKFIILNFEPKWKDNGNIFYAHQYYFDKNTGKLNHFSYSSWGRKLLCQHSLDYYDEILEKYGYKEFKYDHLEAYNGMLGGKKYHISVYVIDAGMAYSEDSKVELVFWPGW